MEKKNSDRLRSYAFALALVPLLRLCGSAGEGPSLSEEARRIARIDGMSGHVVYLENATNGRFITGTLVRLSSFPVIVTNYHLIDSGTDTVHAYLTADGRTRKTACRLLKEDALRDLAAFSLGGDGHRLLKRAGAGTARRGDTVSLSGEHWGGAHDIRRGREVIFLGFPLHYGITFDERRQVLLAAPLARSGLVASDVVDGEFFIDAMASNGNSGSPVFAAGGGKSAYRFIGIIKEFQHDLIPLTLNDGRVIEVPHNTGLGIVIPADVIERFLSGEDSTLP